LQLGDYPEALASFDKTIEFKSDNANAFYNKACCYALQGNVDLAIENLQKTLNLNPDQYRELATNDSDLASIRHDQRFQKLIY